MIKAPDGTELKLYQKYYLKIGPKKLKSFVWDEPKQFQDTELTLKIYKSPEGILYISLTEVYDGVIHNGKLHFTDLSPLRDETSKLMCMLNYAYIKFNCFREEAVLTFLKEEKDRKTHINLEKIF